MISFVLNGRIDGRVYGHVFPLLFLWRCHTQADEIILEYMKERSMCVAGDRMVEMILLFLHRPMFG